MKGEAPGSSEAPGEIDRALAAHYGFTAGVLGFIINYDIKYRMGQGADEERDGI